MNWLFWKEYRQNRVIVIALLVMMVVPYLLFIFDTWYEWRNPRQLLVDWRKILATAGLFSLVISQVALALIGGNAIAGERADRSAEFQVYLPLTRQKILAAKLLLTLTIAATIWLTNPLIIVWSNLESSGNHLPTPTGMLNFVMINAAITGFVFFCVAWFFSAILRSPTFSIAVGLITPLIIISLIVYGGFLIVGEHGGPRADSMIQICYVCISLAVALPSFGIGTWLYLRRVEA